MATTSGVQVRLLVSKWCPVCPQAEAVWAHIAKTDAIDYEVLDVAIPAGKAWVSNLRIKTVPAVVINGALRSVGVISETQARQLIEQAQQSSGNSGAARPG